MILQKCKVPINAWIFCRWQKLDHPSLCGRKSTAASPAATLPGSGWLSSRCLGSQAESQPAGPLQMQQNLFRLQGLHGARRCYYAAPPASALTPPWPAGRTGLSTGRCCAAPPSLDCLPAAAAAATTGGSTVRGNPAEATLPARLRGAGYRGGTRLRWSFQPPPCDGASAVLGGTCNKKMHCRQLRLIVRDWESRRGRANLQRFCLHMCAAPLCAGTNGAAGRFAVKLCPAPFSSLSSLPPVAEGTQ